MLNAYSLIKNYLITSILWFIFMLTIIIERLINRENVNDVFGISLLDITLLGFLSITFGFLFIFFCTHKIYFHNNKFLLV